MSRSFLCILQLSTHFECRYQFRLASKVLTELYVEDHMTPHELVVLRDVFHLPFKHLKGWANISHFLANGIPPKCVPILLIYLLRLLDRFGNANTKLVGPKPILGLDLSKYSISLFEHERDPPCKCRFH